MARKKKRRWKTDPITGLRYERGSLIDIMDEISKSSYQAKRKRRRYYDEKVDISQLPPFLQIFMVIFVVSVFVWVFFGEPISLWWSKNWIYVAIGFLVSITSVGILFVRKWKKQREFEKEQLSKGLTKFVDRHGNVKWGKPEEVEKWKREDEKMKIKESLFNRIVEAIKEFKPVKRHKDEYSYKMELVGALRTKFGTGKVEIRRGYSRPDIVIGDIAIEIKGPTGSAGLKSIPDKCNRYSRHFPRGIIVVLFDVKVNEGSYREWLEGMRQRYPEVKIIRK